MVRAADLADVFRTVTVQPSDRIEYRTHDGSVKSGRVTATSSGGLVLVVPDWHCAYDGCARRTMLEQITLADIVTVNRGMLG